MQNKYKYYKNIEIKIDERLEFETFFIKYTKKNSKKTTSRLFYKIENFIDWYKNQNFPSLIDNLASRDNKIKIFCNFDTYLYIKNKFILLDEIEWLIDENDFEIKIKNIPKFKLVVNVCKRIHKVINVLKNQICNIEPQPSNKELYNNGLLEPIIKSVKQMCVIEESIAADKYNCPLIEVLLESWIIKFYSICHNPDNRQKTCLLKCNDFFAKYFKELKEIGNDLLFLANYVYKEKNDNWSWVFLYRNKLGSAHLINCDEIKKYKYEPSFLVDIYCGKDGNKKILKFISEINKMLKNLCAIYLLISFRLIHTSKTEYLSISFEEALKYIYDSEL